MNNYERIKNMTLDEMAKFVRNRRCPIAYKCKSQVVCYEYEPCIKHLKKWLESESEG